MSRSVIGQSDTKWLKRAGEMMDPCGTPTRTWREGEWCCWYRHNAFLPRRYTTNHLTRLWQSRERWIISMRRRWETVSNAFEMSTAMAMVLLEGLRWLKPETTLAEMGSRAKAAECLGLKPCWKGRVPSASTMAGRMSRSRIFTAGQSSEIRAALLAELPCLQDRDYDGALPDCRNINSGDREVEELRQEGQAMRTKMAEVKHGEPIRPLGGGGARLSDGRCDAPHVEWPV